MGGSSCWYGCKGVDQVVDMDVRGEDPVVDMDVRMGGSSC
jgi:hypothetical protein